MLNLIRSKLFNVIMLIVSIGMLTLSVSADAVLFNVIFGIYVGWFALSTINAFRRQEAVGHA